VDLHDHAFLQNLGRLSAPILAKRRDTRNKPLDPTEEYVVRVLVTAGEVVTVVDQMMYAIDSLSGYRCPKRARQNYPTRAHHMAYHLENHLIRSAALTDRVLHLVNVVFSLGLPDRACTWLSVAENSYVKRTLVFGPLNALKKFLQSSRTQRNVVVHKHRYTDDRLHEIEGYFLLDQMDRNSGKQDPLVFRARHMFKAMADNLVASRKSELRKFNQDTAAHVTEIFAALDGVFAASLAQRQSARPN